LLDALDQSAIRSGQTLPTAQMPAAGPTLKPDPTLRDRHGTPGSEPTEMTGSIYRGTGGVSSPSSASLSGELTLKSVFGNRYEILSLIGQGGMGRVYAARDRELDRVIALKTIKADEEAGEEAIQRFKQELLLARKITHKNVVRIHDLGEAEGIKFFTMEFIEGESLKALIRKRGKIPAGEAVALIRQILSALQEAHSQGIVHRDLKPQNIMVDRGGVPYLMDFGIARAVDATGMTATGAIVGTPDYMSPEQVRGEKAGPESDLFSMGVILYEMVTGDLPYKADSAASKIMMRLSHRPRPPRELSQDIPRYVEAVILKCMEVDLALRYRSAAEILQDVDREDVGRSLTLRVQRAVSRRKGVLAAAAAVVLAAGGAYWFASRGPAAAPAPEGPVQTLAILPFTNAAGTEELEWMRTGLADMLVTDLSQSRYVRPVPGERVAKVMNDLGVAEQTRFDEAALESISKRAAVQSVLYGQYVESGGKLRLDLVLRKAGSGVPVPLKVEGATSQALALVDEITSRVKSQLDLTREQLKGDTDRPVAEVTTASVDALRAYQAGLAQLRQGANQAAIPPLKEATAKDAGFAMAYARLAEAYLNTGEAREAEAAIDRAKDLSEKGQIPLTERYHIHATAALIKDDYETAVKSFAELAKLYPSDPDIQLRLGGAYQELGHWPDAIEAYKKVLELAPDYGSALIELGGVYWNAGNYKDSIRTMEQALAGGTFANDAETMGLIHSTMGLAYRDSANLDKALEHLGVSLEFRRKAGDRRGQAVSLTNLASVYEYRGDIQKALDAERKALAIAREMRDRRRESFILNNIGLTHKVAGDLEKALAAFRESMQIEMEREDYAELANRLDKIAEVYRLKGQYDDALVYLEQAKGHLEKTEAKEEKAINLNYIGLVRKAQGQYDQALEALLAGLPIFQEIHQEMGVAMTQHNLAEIYMNQGRYADAYKALQQALAIYSELHVEHDIAEVKGPLGHLLVALGRLDDAEKELAEAERVAKESKAKHLMPEILLGQAELAHMRGRHEEAAKLFGQANVQANLSGQKEVAVESRVELGHLFLEQGKTGAAESLLLRTRQEAARSRLRPLEAAAATVLAEVYLAKGDAESARKAALDAVSLAERYSGRPVIYQAQAALGDSLQKLGRQEEAMDAYAKAATALEWIRGSLLPEHVGSFVGRSDIQAFLRKTVAVLEKGGRAADAEPLRKWLGASAARVAS
jgi:tetratricopeptide (TPR) repeat protein